MIINKVLLMILSKYNVFSKWYKTTDISMFISVLNGKFMVSLWGYNTTSICHLKSHSNPSETCDLSERTIRASLCQVQRHEMSQNP